MSEKPRVLYPPICPKVFKTVYPAVCYDYRYTLLQIRQVSPQLHGLARQIASRQACAFLLLLLESQHMLQAKGTATSLQLQLVETMQLKSLCVAD